MAFVSQIWKRNRDEVIQSTSLSTHHHHLILLSPLHLAKCLLLCLLQILLLMVLSCLLHVVHLLCLSLVVDLLCLLLIVPLLHLPLSEGLLLLSLMLALVSQCLIEILLLQIFWGDVFLRALMVGLFQPFTVYPPVWPLVYKMGH